MCVLASIALATLVFWVSDSSSKPIHYDAPSRATCTGSNAFERLLKLPGWRVAAMSAAYYGDTVCSWSYGTETVQQACAEALENCSQLLHQRVPVWKDTCRIVRIFEPGVQQDVQDVKLSCLPPAS